jgi:hypothetical protein
VIRRAARNILPIVLNLESRARHHHSGIFGRGERWIFRSDMRSSTNHVHVEHHVGMVDRTQLVLSSSDFAATKQEEA